MLTVFPGHDVSCETCFNFKQIWCQRRFRKCQFHGRGGGGGGVDLDDGGALDGMERMCENWGLIVELTRSNV
jgi:hypothetical protein